MQKKKVRGEGGVWSGDRVSVGSWVWGRGWCAVIPYGGCEPRIEGIVKCT